MEHCSQCYGWQTVAYRFKNTAAAEQKQAKIFIKNNNNMYKNTWTAWWMDGQRDGWMDECVRLIISYIYFVWDGYDDNEGI